MIGSLLLLIVFIAAFFVAVFAVLSSLGQRGKEERDKGFRMEASVSAAHGFPLTLMDERIILAFNIDRDEVGVFNTQGIGHIFPAEAVAAVELTPIYVTESTTSGETRTNRGSQILSAGLGAAVAGPAGLVVGGLSGGSHTTMRGTSRQRLSKMELGIRLLSRQVPNVVVTSSLVNDARDMAARLANIIQTRAAPASQLVEGRSVTTNFLSDEEFAVWRAARSERRSAEPQRGWWQRTFGNE